MNSDSPEIEGKDASMLLGNNHQNDEAAKESSAGEEIKKKKKDRLKDKKGHKKSKKVPETVSSKTNLADSKERKKKKRKSLVFDENTEVCFQVFLQHPPKMSFRSFEVFDLVCDEKVKCYPKNKSPKKPKGGSKKPKDGGVTDYNNNFKQNEQNISNFPFQIDVIEEDFHSDKESDENNKNDRNDKENQKNNKNNKKEKKDNNNDKIDKKRKEKKEKKEHRRHRPSKKSSNRDDEDDLVLEPEKEKQFHPTLRAASNSPPNATSQVDTQKRSSILCEDFANFLPPPKVPPPPPPDSEIPPELLKKLHKKQIMTLQKNTTIIQNDNGFDFDNDNDNDIPPPPAVPPPPPPEVPSDLKRAPLKKKMPIIGKFDLSAIPPPPDTPPPPPPFPPPHPLFHPLPLDSPPPPSLSNNIFSDNPLNKPAIKPPPPPPPPIPPVFFDPDPIPRLFSKTRYSLNSDESNRIVNKTGKHRRVGTASTYEYMEAPEETGNIEDVITCSSNSTMISRSSDPAQSFFLFSSNDLVPTYVGDEEESSYSESVESSDSSHKLSRRVRMDRFCSYSNKIFQDMHLFSVQEREHEKIELNMLQINQRAKKIALKRYKKMLDNYYNEVRGNVDFVEIDTSRDQKVHWRKDPKLIKTNELRVETRILENKIVSIRSENEEARNKMSDLLQIISDKNNELAQIEFEITKYK